MYSALTTKLFHIKLQHTQQTIINIHIINSNAADKAAKAHTISVIEKKNVISNVIKHFNINTTLNT